MFMREPGRRIARFKQMPHYYFNIHNGEVTMDHEGLELPDDASAIARATEEVRSLAAGNVLDGHFVGWHRVEIRDADGRRTGTVRFDEAVKVQLENA